MKTIHTLWILPALFILSACSSDTDDPQGLPDPQGLCANVGGVTGIYWEFAHSIPAPQAQVPIIQNPGGQFVHSQHPLIGFTYPQGFTAFEVTNAQTATLGVNLIRNDN